METVMPEGAEMPQPDLPQEVPPRGPGDEGTHDDPQPDEDPDPRKKRSAR
jgi:hypothetical protein